MKTLISSMQKQLIVLSALMMVLAGWQVALAKPVTVTREYTYRASEADSKLTSRTIALEQVKRMLLEELGTYLVSNTEVRDSALTKDEIVTYTSGWVATVVIVGQSGQPASMTMVGILHKDGAAQINVQGLTGKSEYTIKHVQPGKLYSYSMRGKFTQDNGRASRIESRPCEAIFIKQ